MISIPVFPRVKEGGEGRHPVAGMGERGLGLILAPYFARLASKFEKSTTMT
jgi:hypothetical protein